MFVVLERHANRFLRLMCISVHLNQYSVITNNQCGGPISLGLRVTGGGGGGEGGGGGGEGGGGGGRGPLKAGTLISATPGHMRACRFYGKNNKITVGPKIAREPMRSKK